MNLLFLDFETQGEDPRTTNPTEVGAVVVYVGPGEDPNRVYMEGNHLSSLIYEGHYPPQTPEIVELTGITDRMLRDEGVGPRDVFTELLYPLVERSDYCIAHNAAFDRGIYEAVSHRLHLTPPQPKRGWICTVMDVPYPKKYKCKKLSHLAYDHGVMVDPKTLHRALDDVRLLSRFLLSRYPIETVIAYRDTPWVVLALNGVKPPWEDGGVSNTQAKKLKYSWEKPWGTELNFPKRWVKRVKETQIEEEKALMPPHFTLTKFLQP